MDCVQYNGLSIVHVDDRNERLFVIATSETVTNSYEVRSLLHGAKDFVARCKKSWSQSWAVSIFSEAKYAGYKDETQIRQFVVDGTWEKGYLAEYDNHSHVLILFPLIPAKRQELSLNIDKE